MNIKDEKEICEYLGIPSIPKKLWDGKSHFKKGVAIIEFTQGGEGYASCRYEESDEDVRIMKVFSTEPFTSANAIYPVPSYMDDNINEMFFDNDESKEAMEQLLQEKEELVNEGVEKEKEEIYEWGFPFIHTKKEAIAYLKSKNTKGRISEKEDVLKMKLQNLYMQEKQLKK